MTELKITARDWLIVAVTGALLASSLGAFCFFAVGFGALKGAFSGAIFGAFVSAFSALLIPFMNAYALPKAPKFLWNLIAAIFSFLSGFLGSIASFWTLFALKEELPPAMADNALASSVFVGLNAYLVGALIYRFVKARNEKEELEALLLKSRLGSLETQLNSHFLFNALNSLSELIHVDATKAEDMTLKLSAFLRAASRETPLVSLKEELQNAKTYIELENIRFNGAITANIEATSEALKILVPKFSVQLLCENGVKHGFSANKKTLAINVSATLKNGSLSVIVSNDGAPVLNPAFGVGLSNLKERLQRLQNGSLELLDRENVAYQIALEGAKG